MMRVSTNTLFDQGTKSMLQQQNSLFKLQQQISTGKRIVTPSDDPIGAARAHELTQAASLNAQYMENRQRAGDSLKLVDSTLGSVTNLIQNVQSLTVAVGNPTLSDSDRSNMAIELRGRFEELLGLANTTDDEGNYLFSGFQGKTQPFVQVAGGVQYAGDQGQRLAQVSASRQLSVSETGLAIFEQIKNGNGTFVTAATNTNNGSGVIGSGSVTDAASLTGDDYKISFSVTGGVTTFEVTNATPGTVLSGPYTSGEAISFDGLQFAIKGAPADGDTFTVQPSRHESLFTTIGNFIAALETPASGAAGNARLTNSMNSTLQNLDHALTNVLGTRAAAGARLQEVDALQQAGEDTAVQYQQSLSRLQDLDFAQAISDLTRQQALLEAAQQSFIRISGLSLFNKI
ncbi:flagellar hook-associated protein FlgL [Nitrosomonas mobilis]|uniref:Flagellar hook-associated protein 3 n=1 Tax=Nitrosomonas mobilis TaxID=51642 RepID=A0A1G5SDU1_9PROT|nr:flagellar hook-associated protein FlgL [Nitrosomonas mobilis]SCZ85157.1 Flagellar hook-associated protein 3 [Nitrosomonas mobilis]